MPENKKNLIEGFNAKGFAENLAEQAVEVIPKDIKGNDRTFIIEVMKKFCFMAGEAIEQDQSLGFNAEQAVLICQFIGEWTFHKSIDLTKGGVDINLREGILQKVAFTIFEIVKQAIKKNMPQEEIIPLVETHVNKSFRSALEELNKKNIIDSKTLDNAENQSNVDNMAQANVEEGNQDIQEMNDKKILKLASLALLMKNLNEEKREIIIKKFNKPEERVLRDYLRMDSLETKIDPRIAARCLNEFKNNLPEPRNTSISRCMLKLKKIINSKGLDKIMTLLKHERPGIKNFIKNIYANEIPDISTNIASTLYSYILEKAL